MISFFCVNFKNIFTYCQSKENITEYSNTQDITLASNTFLGVTTLVISLHKAGMVTHSSKTAQFHKYYKRTTYLWVVYG